MDVDWRTHQHWIIINDLPVNVVELGEGSPLVFVHGLSGSWPNWLEQLPVFAGLNGDASGTRVSPGFGLNGDASGTRVSPGFGSHRVVALDLPGFGHSPLPAERISIAGYVDTLERLLDALQLDTATVVGNSMGGLIAAEFAARLPERIERLVLVSPAGLSTYHEPRATRALPRLRRMERVVSAYGGWIAAHSDALSRQPGLRNASFGLIVPHPDRLPGPLVAEQLRGVGKPGFIPALEAILEEDLSPHLPQIACPTQIVWGSRDRVITVRDAERFAELIPGSHKVVYEDTGHMAMLERPVEFNTLLAELLSS
jgi:pimeloyl-ACP methyl ester carboxylesterase